MAYRISISKMVAQIIDLSYLLIVLRSLRIANQDDLYLVIDNKRGMLCS